MIPKDPKRMMRRSIPIAAAAALVSGAFLAHPVVVHWGQSAYEEEAFASAANRFSFIESVNVYEGYRAPFNRGTSLMQAGELAEAREPLFEALEAAPQDESCQVRFNLVLTIERQGDDAVRQMNATTAVLLYEEALALIEEDDCDRSPTQDEHEQLEEARIRIEQKLEQLQPDGEPPPPDQNPDEDPDDDGGGDGGNDEDDEDEDDEGDDRDEPSEPDDLEDRLDDLDERNQQSNRSQQDLRDEREWTEDGNELDYSNEPRW